MTVGELGRRMDSAELSEWLAFDRVEGIPDPHWQTALIALLIARTMGGDRRAQLEDFLPRREPLPEAKPQSTEEIASFFRQTVERVEARHGVPHGAD